MGFTAVNALCCILMTLIIPCLSGRGFLKLLYGGKEKKISPIFSFISGYLILWTLIELIAIPVTVFKAGFSVLTWIVLSLMGLLSVVGIIYIIKNYSSEKGAFKDALFEVIKDKKALVLLIIFAVLFIIFICMNSVTLFYDADDSRFLVSAGDIVRNDHILLTDPVTGKALDAGYRDFKKDLISQWAVYIAYMSKVTGVNTTVFAHTVYPIIAMLLIFGIYTLLLSEQKKEDRLLGLILLIFLFIFGNYSTHSQETVSMIRVWQGKATLAVFGVLTMIYIFRILEETGGEWQCYILLFLANLSMCLMSSMGIVIAAMMMVVYGCYAAFKLRKVRVAILIMLLLIPNAALYLFSELYTIERFLN
ncbi:MAG: hypothetical protein J5517_00260 [Eubacterium sp.]|nr:hypothetical protein [Eubacterium sp.]